MSSKTNTIAANGARVAAPKVAAIATRANADGDTDGTIVWRPSPASPPAHELINRIGASVPPDVPEASAIHQTTSLPTARAASVATASRPARASSITS